MEDKKKTSKKEYDRKRYLSNKDYFLKQRKEHFKRNQRNILERGDKMSGIEEIAKEIMAEPKGLLDLKELLLRTETMIYEIKIALKATK